MAVIEHAYVMTWSRNRAPIRTVTLVGAGGIGARIVPLLVKMLPEGGRINVVDPDTVQPRNLWRQHFVEDDLGLPKAEVMANRYHGERGVEVAAFVEPFGLSSHYATTDILIGAVDNRAARAQMLVDSDYPIYIDAGNLTDHGQVLLTIRRCMEALDVITGSYYPHVVMIAGDCMPEIFDAARDNPEEEGCNRPDLQTIAINNMAAAVTANAVYTILNHVPFWAAGWAFTPLSCEVIKVIMTENPTSPRRLLCRGVWHV